MKPLHISKNLKSGSQRLQQGAVRLGSSVALAAQLLVSQPVQGSEPPTPDIASLVSASPQVQNEDFSFPVKLKDSLIPSGVSIPLIPYVKTQTGVVTGNLYDLLQSLKVNEPGDVQKLTAAKKAILIDFLTLAASSYPDATGGKKVYMYCPIKCATEIDQILGDTKIEGLNLKPYEKRDGVVYNEFAANSTYTFVFSPSDLWPGEAISTLKQKAREEGKTEGIAEGELRITELERELGEESQSSSIALLAAGSAGLALGGLAGAGLMRKRKDKELDLYKDRSLEQRFYMALDDIFHRYDIDFQREEDGTYRFWGGQHEKCVLTPHYSKEKGGAFTLSVGESMYLTPDGQYTNIHHTKPSRITLEQLDAFLHNHSTNFKTTQNNITRLQHITLQGWETPHPKCRETLENISSLLSSKNFNNLLFFRQAKRTGDNNAIYVFRGVIEDTPCEISIDQTGKIQVLMNGIKTPENGRGDFSEVKETLEGLYS